MFMVSSKLFCSLYVLLQGCAAQPSGLRPDTHVLSDLHKVCSYLLPLREAIMKHTG